jgi:nucleotidyltransferase substrate binding protein (TIGR01987 family)
MWERVETSQEFFSLQMEFSMDTLRWIQRFQNYSKACQQLRRFLAQPNLNELELQGLIQCFEYTFELAWKTLKDYLENLGWQPNSPRNTLQIAFKAGFIAQGDKWILALEKRNMFAHTYEEKITSEAKELIVTSFAPLLFSLEEFFKEKLS